MSQAETNFIIPAIFSFAEGNTAATHPILPSRMVDSVGSFPQPISFSQLTLATPSALQETDCESFHLVQASRPDERTAERAKRSFSIYTYALHLRLRDVRESAANALRHENLQDDR